MPRVLLIAYALPPHPSAGALRPGSLARYLPEFGWDVTTVSCTGGSAASGLEKPSARHRTRATASLRAAARNVRDALLFPDNAAPWIPQAIRCAHKALSGAQFDAVISTAHPPSVHVVGWYVAKTSGLPWIADYRDPWAGNAYLKRGRIRTALERFTEKAMLRQARAITAISQPVAEQIGKFHDRSVTVIPNGYDPDEWESIPHSEPPDFDLCFTGSMYDGKRSPELLFGAVRALSDRGEPAGSRAQVHFYGRNTSNVMPAAQRCGIAGRVHEHGIVPRRDAMRAQRSAAALLVFLNMDPATASEMGSKYLEYIGARRPILAFGPPDGPLQHLLERHRAGWYASTPAQAERAVAEAYASFARGDWKLSNGLDIAPTAREMAGRFAALLPDT